MYKACGREGLRGCLKRSGCRDEHRHHETERIDQQVAFAPFDLFAALVATLAPQFRGLDALTVQAPCRRVLMTPHLLADSDAQGVVDTLPITAVAPLGEVPIDTGE
jgi:hypothetical protein